MTTTTVPDRESVIPLIGEVPDPGVYTDVGMDVYLSWPMASNSTLSALLRSPAHAYVAMRGEVDDSTDAKDFGTAVHAAVLEPERFESEYAVEPDITSGKLAEYKSPRATKAYKEQVQAMESRGLTVLREPDMEDVRRIQEAVRDHPSAGVLLQGEGPAEASIVWEDPETGVPVKIRPDWIAEDVGAVVDLKTTRSAAEEDFRRDAWTMGYFRKAWIYLKGCQELGLDVEHFTFLAVEKEPPFCTAVYRVRDDALQWAEKECRALLDLCAKCWAEGEWPGYGDSVKLLGMPAWAYDRIDEREARLEAMT